MALGMSFNYKISIIGIELLWICTSGLETIFLFTQRTIHLFKRRNIYLNVEIFNQPLKYIFDRGNTYLNVETFS